VTTLAQPRPSRAYLEADPLRWLSFYLRPYLVDELGEPIAFAEHQREFWQWAWQIEMGRPPVMAGVERDALIAVWPRGGAKSTSVEMATTALAARGKRKYALYVSGVQTQADDHVANIAEMLTSERIAADYPAVADRAIGAFGPRAWRRNRLQTGNGFTIDALGLDTAMRGVKVGRTRPDLIILDDIDDATDSSYVTGNKRRIITRSLLPAGNVRDTMVIGIQNLILGGGIFDRIVHGQAGFLQDALVLGPVPSVRGLEVTAEGGKWRITGGTASWPEGQGLAACQALIDRFGLEAFLAENQHEVGATSGRVHGKFSPAVHRWDPAQRPLLSYVVGGLDHGSEGETANHTAGIVGGVLEDGRVLLLAEFRERGADVAVRLMTWMRQQELRWKGAGSIRWASDGTEHLGNQLLRTEGFAVQPSRMGGKEEASREGRVRLVGRRLAVDAMGKPGLYYLGELVEWVTEVESYRREQPKFEGDRTLPKIIRTNDHLMTATEYMVEMLDGGPAVPDEAQPAYAGVVW
jgi:hypothetical protein